MYMSYHNHKKYIDAISIAFFNATGLYFVYKYNNIKDINSLIVLAKRCIKEYTNIIDSIKKDDKELNKLFSSDNIIMNHFIAYKTEDGALVEYEEDCSIKGSSHERRLIRDIRSIPIDNYYDGVLNICVSRCNSIINITKQFIKLMLYLRRRCDNKHTYSDNCGYLDRLLNNIYIKA